MGTIFGHFRAGKNSRCQVEGVTLNEAHFDATARGDDLDTSHFETLGFEQGLIGIEVMDWTLGGNWDAGRNNFDDPPGLYPRADLGTINLVLSQTDGTFFSSSPNRVLSSKVSSQVRQLVTFESSGKSQGSFSLPTGSG